MQLLTTSGTGCPPPPTPRGGRARRFGHKARVGCNLTGQNWELQCMNDKWQGYYENCTGNLHTIFELCDQIFESIN